MTKGHQSEGPFCVGNKGACPKTCFQFVISARVDEYFVRMAGIMRGEKNAIFVLKHVVIVTQITMERVELHDQIGILEAESDGDFFVKILSSNEEKMTKKCDCASRLGLCTEKNIT